MAKKSAKTCAALSQFLFCLLNLGQKCSLLAETENSKSVKACAHARGAKRDCPDPVETSDIFDDQRIAKRPRREPLRRNFLNLDALKRHL